MQKLTKEQAAIVGACTGRLAGPFEELHEYIERIMGRPVWTHELASRELAKEISDKAMPDFLAICREQTDVILDEVKTFL